MEMKRWIRSRREALIAPLIITFGCAVAPLETESTHLGDTEATAESQQALGSTNPNVTNISTWNGLVGMASNGNYKLTADIDAAGKTWTPKDFTGTLNGNAKIIKNLTINVAGDAGFFRNLNQAIVTNLKFTNLKVTGTWVVGGLSAWSQDSQVDQIALEGTITATNGFAVGGLYGEMLGGSVSRSYTKGTVQSAMYFAGGLAGFMADGALGLATIERSYAQVTVSPNTADVNRTVSAGGIAGYGHGVDIHDVYAVGNVTGRNRVGGLVGYLGCQGAPNWLLYKGIYRGDVVDKSAPTGGWAGTVGGRENCTARFTHLSWDRDLDPSTNALTDTEAVLAQRPGTTAQHRGPTSASGGFYCLQPNNCFNDNNFETSKWDAGTSSQHHILKDMPGPNAQIR